MTSPVLDMPPEAFYDAPWTDILPWLARYSPGQIAELADLVPAPDWWLSESPAVTSMAVELPDLCAALARVYVSAEPETPIMTGLLGLPETLPISALPLGARARTTLQRLGVHTVGAVAQRTVRDLFEIRGTGTGTVYDIVEALIFVAITRRPEIAALDVGATRAGAGAETRPAPYQLPAPHAQLLEDLVQLAVWRHIRGDSAGALLAVTVEDGAPEEIQEAATRIGALSADDIFSSTGLPDPVDELTHLLGGLDDRQVMVLRERSLAVVPKTLAELADQLGVTRERVRQIEKVLKDLFVRTFGFGTTVGNLLASLRVEIQPVAALDRLIGRHPILTKEVPGIEVPLWLVLDRLDDNFKVTDGWAAAPDVEVARDVTHTILEDFEADHGAVEITMVESAVNMPADELRSWLQWCGYELLDGHALTRTRSMPDHAAGILAVEGQALELEEILQRMGKDRSVRALANRLSADGRFTRSDRTKWALTDWGVETYTSIRHQVSRAVANAGGEIALDDLIRTLTERFDVSPNSIQTYAGSGDFETRSGMVRHRQGRTATRRRPEDTRRLYRDNGMWRYRLTVTRDHLRGSGFPVPGAVATIVGCAPGEVVELPSRLGAQTIRWTGTQAGSGTIKRFLDSLGIQEDQSVFLEFVPGERFDVVPVPELVEDPVPRALMLVGAAGRSDVEDAFAEAVGLEPGAKRRHILSALQSRGDDDVSALLEQAWGWSGREDRPGAAELSGKMGE